MLLRLSILSAVTSRIEHMIEDQSGEVSAGMLPDPALLDSRVLAGWVRALASLGDSDSLPVSTDGSAGIGSDDDACVVSDAERVEQLAVLERLKAAASAAQARVTVGFDASQRAAQRAAGLPERKVGAGVGAQVGLARRDRAVRGARHLIGTRALVGGAAAHPGRAERRGDLGVAGHPDRPGDRLPDPCGAGPGGIRAGRPARRDRCPG